VERRAGALRDFALFGLEHVRVQRAALIDSYDSSLGSYASQKGNFHARERAHLGSNGDIELAALAKVYGRAQYGPDEEDHLDRAPDALLSDGFGPAHGPLTLPLPDAPDAPPGDALTVASKRSATLGPGVVTLARLVTKRHASLRVLGPCDLVITGDALAYGQSTWTLDASAGPIRLYAAGSLRLRADARVVTPVEDPSQVSFYLTGEHRKASAPSPEIVLEAEARFHGTLHAPRLSLRIGNAFELFGRAEARWIELAPGGKLHFDERLAAGSLDAREEFAVLTWRPLDPKESP